MQLMRVNLLILMTLLPCALTGVASQTNSMSGDLSRPPTAPAGSGWFGTLKGGYVHQFDTSIDGGGDFDVNRFAIVGGVGYRPDFSRSVSLSAGYDWNDYGFSNTGLGSPWGNVHTLKLAAPVRWGLDEYWTLLVVPTIRWNAEDGADWGQAFTGGGFAGFAYRFSEKLTLGPGFGALTQVEDSPSFFPVIIVQWEIVENLRLETGRGLGASQGPGLSLSYALSRDWQLILGGRYEKLRFRLSESGVNANGAGEDRGVPVYLGLTWNWSREGSVSLLGGIRFAGKLALDDADGDEISSRDYSTAPYVGFSFNLRY